MHCADMSYRSSQLSLREREAHLPKSEPLSTHLEYLVFTTLRHMFHIIIKGLLNHLAYF